MTNWHRMEIARHTGQLAEIDDRVAQSMKQIKVEVQNEGKWTDEKLVGISSDG